MRIAVIETKVYEYVELSESAKETARRNVVEEYHNEMTFTEMMEGNLRQDFPSSDLKVEYSLCYCQGDGLNIYGKMAMRDVARIYEIVVCADNLEITKKEYRFIQYLKKGDFPDVRFDSNHRYCYYTDKATDIEDYIVMDMENQYFSNIPYDFIKKIAKVVNEYLCKYCKSFEEEGYEYFYEIDEEEMIVCCEANEIEFTEDGEFYY